MLMTSSRAEHARRRRHTIEMVTRAALEGKRCPTNLELGCSVLPELAREGLFKIEVCGKNYRIVTILTGEHAGKKTAPHPHRSTPYVVIGPAGRVAA